MFYSLKILLISALPVTDSKCQILGWYKWIWIH